MALLRQNSVEVVDASFCEVPDNVQQKITVLVHGSICSILGATLIVMQYTGNSTKTICSTGTATVPLDCFAFMLGGAYNDRQNTAHTVQYNISQEKVTGSALVVVHLLSDDIGRSGLGGHWQTCASTVQ